MDMKEKRKFIRKEVHVPLAISRLKGVSASPLGNALSANMSEGGVCFTAPEFVSMSHRLVFEIELPTLASPVKTIARVAWIVKDPEEGTFMIGSQFLEASKEDRELIKKYMDSVLK